MPDRPAECLSADCARTLDEAAKLNWEQLPEEHGYDHQTIFRRVHIDLGRSTAAELPGDQRVRPYGKQQDAQLAALHFQLGRYLLVASFRLSTQAGRKYRQPSRSQSPAATGGC